MTPLDIKGPVVIRATGKPPLWVHEIKIFGKKWLIYGTPNGWYETVARDGQWCESRTDARDLIPAVVTRANRRRST